MAHSNNIKDTFIRQLNNVVSLMGGDDEILSILKHWDDGEDRDVLVQKLKEWNNKKTTEIKTRLSRLSTIQATKA